MKKELEAIWRSKFFQVSMDLCRVLMLVVVILIFYRLGTEIEIVKLLNSDPCALCMNKTGATCFYQVADVPGRQIPEFNITQFEKLIP